jgi:quercetin dioxygenase-like cupin family protein/DNA-binding Xre family transcriptional regulator
MPKATKRAPTAARDRRLGRVKDSFGPALKKARRIRHLTLHELADRIGCSPSALSKIENQKAAPSFSMVYGICRALRMDVTTLLENPTPPRAIVTKAGRHTVFHTTGMEFQALVQATPEHRMEVHVVDIAPGAHSGPPMGHGPGEVVGLVFEGTLKLTVDGKPHNVEPGDSFAFSYDRPHSFGNSGARPTRVLFVLAPPVDFASRSLGTR